MPRAPATPDVIKIRGARQHNLRGIDVDIPLGQLTVITGVSGSGKSTLAFDTLYAEGQRRYVESFSAYARQFLERMDRPDVDRVEGIPPAVAIERSRPIRGSRSTVATMSELLDHAKLLWAKIADLHCVECGRPVSREGPRHAALRLSRLERGRRVVVGFEMPLRGRTPADVIADLRAGGLFRILVGERAVDLAPDGANLPRRGPAFVVVDRAIVGRTGRNRLVESFETAFRAGAGRAVVRVLANDDHAAQTLRFSDRLHCPDCDRDYRAPTPNLFSFNSPVGACETCHGFGRTSGIDWDLVVPDPALSLQAGAVKPLQMPSKRRWRSRMLKWARDAGIPVTAPWRDLDPDTRKRVLLGDGAWPGVNGFFEKLKRKIYKVHVRVLLSRFRGYPVCHDCDGARLGPEGRAWRVGGRSLPDALAMDVTRARAFFAGLRLPRAAQDVARLLLKEIRGRLQWLEEVGLGYLGLDRSARTLSGGEVQRVNLTAALGTHLVNTLFVLDEPSIGLHPRDNGRLVGMLRRLCDEGNSVVVVEHDPAILTAADHVIDLGPGAGEEGGRVTAVGTPAALRDDPASLTGAYLAGRKRVALPPRKPDGSGDLVGVRGARAHNLDGVDLLLRTGELTVLTGVSGSGKSSLAHDVLFLALTRALGRPEGTPGPHDAVVGVEHVTEAVLVEQGGVGQTSRANPATYVGAWDGVRALFASLPASKEARFGPGTFSFNVAGGRCERCKGDGRERVEMQFLSDVDVTCPDCDGTRFRPEVREITWEGLSISDVLRLTTKQAVERFEAHPRIAKPLRALLGVGLGYLRLGQPLSTLSSGEIQRLRLATALVDREKAARRVYVFDEPTTGLHLDDVAVLVRALRDLADRGHAVLVVEHHVDVMWAADRVVDLGPEGGPGGGEVVADGTPAQVARGPGHTARFLRAARRKPSLKRRVAVRKAGPPAIQISGAREHNLRGVTLDLPRDELVVVSGPSGSGKSTLAFDIVFAEGQRRYIDTLSAYARQFVGQLARPDVDHVAGIPPTVAIEQRRTRGSRRSTVATMTEVAHFLRLLFARTGAPHCPRCDRPLRTLPPDAIYDRILTEYRNQPLQLFAPRILGRKGFHKEVFEDMVKRGHRRALADGALVDADPPPKLDRYREHDVEEEIASLKVTRANRPALKAALDEALTLGNGAVTLRTADGTTRTLSVERTCPRDGATVPELDPRFFSHNSHRGWCPACKGLGARPQVDALRLPLQADKSLANGAIGMVGIEPPMKRAFLRDVREILGLDTKTLWRNLPKRTQRTLLLGNKSFEGAGSRVTAFFERAPDIAIDWFGDYVSRATCDACNGLRLRPEARAVRAGGFTYPALLALPVQRFLPAVDGMTFSKRDGEIAKPILRELRERVTFLESIGLSYLTLDRTAATLSGGETQRIRLAAQLGSNLRGVCYVLDEPTIGLHPRDNEKLLNAVTGLRDRGNSLVVVEHDLDTIRRAQRVVDLGPGGGRHGGRLVAMGTPAALERDPDSPTGRVLARPAPALCDGNGADGNVLKIAGVKRHNLRGVDAAFPLERLVAVTGVSGAGKSTLVLDVLHDAVRSKLLDKPVPDKPFRRLSGAQHLTRVQTVDATPVGKTPRSVPATYLKIWDHVRKALAGTEDARTRGYGPGRFSFNVKGGRCATCDGMGEITVEMSFLPNVRVPCEACDGARFGAETLEITWRGRHAAGLLDLTFEEALDVFGEMPRIEPAVRLMNEIGLGYLTLGQPSPTLSGGEAQRLKLVAELARGSRSGSTLYLLDEPTIGLHGEDVDRLLDVLRRLVERGNTVLVVEHHLEFIAQCDHVIDLGPDGGDAGGEIVVAGSPRDVARAWRRSATGRALREMARGAAPVGTA